MATLGNAAVARTRGDLVSILTGHIDRGEIAEGDLLPSERQLAEAFGLSRSMVREALRTLSERHLIDIIPGRGSVVRGRTASTSAKHLISMFGHMGVTPRYLIEARSMIEAEAAAQAAHRADPEAIERVWHAVHACNTETDLIDKVAMDLAFHLAVVRASGNPLVELMFRAIQPYVVEILLRSLTDSVVSQQGLAFHERIAQAIADRDSARAAMQMQEHLTLGLVLFGTDIDRDLNLVARDVLDRLVNPAVTLEDLMRLSHEG